MDETRLLFDDIAEVAGDADEALEILGEHELRIQDLEDVIMDLHDLLADAEIVRVHVCPHCGEEFRAEDDDEE